ncbi:MAG: hypothetical protein CMJ31_09090 [Phycisphaerae bacterium]|nr:hypothetical protein [Phycisphaerae bacterium]
MNRRHPIEHFRVDDHGALVRTSIAADDHRYEHRCSLDTLQAVTHHFDGGDSDQRTLNQIVGVERVAWTQAAVALAFLKERGIVERRDDINHAASGDCYLNAMTEYHALREKGPEPVDAG